MKIDENYDLRAACRENGIKQSLIGGGFAYISGWCDYTGWDCQSGAERFDALSLESALALCPQDVRRVFEDMRAKNETERPNTGGL